MDVSTPGGAVATTMARWDNAVRRMRPFVEINEIPELPMGMEQPRPSGDKVSFEDQVSKDSVDPSD